MNKLLTGILVFSLFFSCNNNRTKPENTNSTENKNFIELAEKLNGLWISDSYLNNIEKKKSIYLSKNYDTKILGFYLDKNTLLSDAAFLDGFTEHEGGYVSPIKYDELTGKFINDMPRLSEYPPFPDPFELTYDGNNKIEMYFPKTKTTDKYRKVDSDLQTEIRRILIEGNYKSVQDNSGIRFDSDGKVHHFKDFKHYELVYDFENGFKFDAILFSRSSQGDNWEEREIYKFKIASNSLHLQHVNINWETMEHETDDIIHVLERE